MPNENRKDLCGLTFNWLGTPRGMLWLIYRVYTQDATQDDLGRHVNMSGSTSLNRRRCRSLFLSTTGLFGRGCFTFSLEGYVLITDHYTLCNLQSLLSRLEAEIAKPLIDTFMWQGFLVFRFRYFQKSKLMALKTKFPGWMSLERVTLTEKKLKQVMFVEKMFTTVLWVRRDLCWFVVNLTCVKGMKRAGWTEVEIPEDLHEMVITWESHRRRGAPAWGDFMAAQGR